MYRRILTVALAALILTTSAVPVAAPTAYATDAGETGNTTGNESPNHEASPDPLEDVLEVRPVCDPQTSDCTDCRGERCAGADPAGTNLQARPICDPRFGDCTDCRGTDCVPDPCAFLPCDPEPSDLTDRLTIYDWGGDICENGDCVPPVCEVVPCDPPCVDDPSACVDPSDRFRVDHGCKSVVSDCNPCAGTGSDCVPDPCRLEPHGKVCLYADTLIRSLKNWDPLVDGVPNPTLDCASGPIIPWVDSDGDGKLDPVDDDDDCDHISDDLEGNLSMERLNSDTDDDGVVDTTDLTPTTNTPVAALVRAMEFELLNWDTGPSDLFAPDDPFLREDAGITNDDGAPGADEALVVGMMTEGDHLHQDKVYDYADKADKEERQDMVEFSQDIEDYELSDCLDCYPMLEFHFPLHDHDVECLPNLCPEGHPYNHEEDQENERYIYKRPTWNLLRLSAASGEAMSLGSFESAQLDGKKVTVTHDDGEGWSIEFTIKRATNTSDCGVINALLGSLEGSGNDDYVTRSEFQDEESESDHDCPRV